MLLPSHASHPLACCRHADAAANVGGATRYLLFECVDYRYIEEQEGVPVQERFMQLASEHGGVEAVRLFRDQSAVAVAMETVRPARYRRVASGREFLLPTPDPPPCTPCQLPLQHCPHLHARLWPPLQCAVGSGQGSLPG